MSARRSRAAGLALLLALAAVLSACGHGGFGSAEPTRTASPTRTYVALGDGFSSGPYLGKDTSGTGCLRGTENYPSLVAHSLGIQTFTDATCFGATTKSLTSPTGAPSGGKKLAAQLDAVNKNVDLVTLGIGIEDDNLLSGMFHICSATPCGTDILAPQLLKELQALGKTLTTEVRTIQQVAPTATIVVVGYPQIMPATGLCSALPAITDTQLSYAAYTLGQLNTLLRSAAQQTGASYIDVAALSANHTVCSNVPWVHGSKASPGKFEAFHPTAAEQKAVADAILTSVRTPS